MTQRHMCSRNGVLFPGTMGSCGFQSLVPTASSCMLTPVLGCLLALRTSSMPQVSPVLDAHASVTLLIRSLSSSYSLQPYSSSMHCPAVTFCSFCCVFLCGDLTALSVLQLLLQMSHSPRPPPTPLLQLATSQWVSTSSQGSHQRLG